MLHFYFVFVELIYVYSVKARSHLVKAEAKKNKEQVKGIKEEKKRQISEKIFAFASAFFSV